jgi:hypothetical protein
VVVVVAELPGLQTGQEGGPAPMTTPPTTLITRPGGPSAKNARRAGAPNTQPSGENLMVGTITSPAHNKAVREIQQLLYDNADRFVEADHASGAVLVRFTPLAALVADLVTQARAERAALWELLKRSVRTGIELAGHNTAVYQDWFDVHTAAARLRVGLCAVLGHDTDPTAYLGDARVLADLRELAGEARLREQEVIALTAERDQALARVAELAPGPAGGGAPC